MKQKVKLLIESHGKILVLNPINKTKLTLIGGTVEPFETPIKAAIREGFEEADLKLYPADFEAFFTTVYKSKRKFIRFYCYLISKDNISFNLKEKHKFFSLEWVPIEMAIHRLRGVEKLGVQSLSNSFKNSFNQDSTLGLAI